MCFFYQEGVFYLYIFFECVDIGVFFQWVFIFLRQCYFLYGCCRISIWNLIFVLLGFEDIRLSFFWFFLFGIGNVRGCLRVFRVFVGNKQVLVRKVVGNQDENIYRIGFQVVFLEGVFYIGGLVLGLFVFLIVFIFCSYRVLIDILCISVSGMED